MNCTKCGKEIPEGENQICDECQKKILEEISNAEKDDEKQKEDEAKKASFKASKEKAKFPESRISAIIWSIFIIIVAVALGILMFNKTKAEEGNTIGNIRNYGYGAISGKYIYYLSPNEDSSKVGIFRIKKDGSDKKEIYMCDEDLAEIVSINVSGSYIYFIQIGDATDDQDVNNRIYRMKKDGSDIQLINDNEFNDNCYEIYVINGYVYYIDVDADVARMKLDGSNKEKVAENKTGYLGITKDYIIYNVTNEEQTTQDESDDTTTSSTASYTTYIMNIDGSNQRPIIKDKRLYSVNIEGDYIYYTNDSKNICRTRIDSNEEEVISNVEAYNLNVNNGFAYYLNYKDAENEDYTVCIYKIPLNAEDKTPALIKELDSYSTFLDIVGNYALYMDSNDTSGSINLVDVENSENIINLYYLDYGKYSANSSDTEDSQVPEENVTEEDVVSTDETQTNTVSENTTSENTVPANNAVNNTAN